MSHSEQGKRYQMGRSTIYHGSRRPRVRRLLAERLESRAMLAGNSDNFTKLESGNFSWGRLPDAPLPDGSFFSEGSYSPDRGRAPRTTPNIRVTSTTILRDGDGSLVSSIPVGQMISVQVNFVTEAVPPQSRYDILFAVNGLILTMDNISWATGNGSWFAIAKGWYAQPGQRSLVTVVDANNEVVESLENDNSAQQTFLPTSPAELQGQWIFPVGDRYRLDVATQYYADVDPRTTHTIDFAGNAFARAEGTGWNIRAANFRAQDQGIPILAAAAGTVMETVDGNFDRETNIFSSANSNYVTIDHGNGWRTTYSSLARDSITVSVGQTVRAGEIIGNMGASGPTAGSQLYFLMTRNGMPIEPMWAAGQYFLDPSTVTYQEDLVPTVLDAVMTRNEPSSHQWASGLAEQSHFFGHTGSSATLAVSLSHLRQGDIYTFEFLEPDGTVAASYDQTATESQLYVQVAKLLSPSYYFTVPGQWQARFLLNGELLVSEPFVSVVSPYSNGPPQMQLSVSGAQVSFGQATAVLREVILDVGIFNPGGQPLTLGNWKVPEGFEIVSVPTQVAAFDSGLLRLRAVDRFESKAYGEVRFTTNDPRYPEFWFMIEAEDSTPNPFTEVILPGPALAYRVGDDPVAFDTSAEFTSLFAVPHELAIHWEGGRQLGDQLLVQSSGSGDGQIEVVNDQVRYQGVTIGAITQTGNAPNPLVFDFNSSISNEAVTALLRSIQFNTSSVDAGPRFLRAMAKDTFGFSSTNAVKSVRVHPAYTEPAKVSNVQVGSGDAARSLVDAVNIQFDATVVVPSDAIRVVRRSDQAIVDTVVQLTQGPEGTLARVVFSGALTEFGSLRDGNYMLTLDASRIYRADGSSLDGDGNGTAGGDLIVGDDAADGFYRLFGDTSGNRVVELGEFNLFRSSFGRQTGNAGFIPEFDFNQDGNITLADFNKFRSNFGQNLPFA